MKTTIAKAIKAYEVLNKSKLHKMDSANQIALVKNLRPLRKNFEEYDTFIKESVKKLAPEGWEEMQKILNEVSALKSEEQNERMTDKNVREAFKAREDYNSKIIDLDRDESQKEVELDITTMSEDVIGQLFASNELTSAEMLAVMDILC